MGPSSFTVNDVILLNWEQWLHASWLACSAMTEGFPNLRDELVFAVRNDVQRDTMEAEDMANLRLRGAKTLV